MRCTLHIYVMYFEKQVLEGMWSERMSALYNKCYAIILFI